MDPVYYNPYYGDPRKVPLALESPPHVGANFYEDIPTLCGC